MSKLKKRSISDSALQARALLARTIFPERFQPAPEALPEAPPVMRTQQERDALAGSRFELEGGMRSSEVILLRRALGYYVSAYNSMKHAAKTQWEKNESQQYIDAALQLDDRLLRNLKRIDTKGESA